MGKAVAIRPHYGGMEEKALFHFYSGEVFVKNTGGLIRFLGMVQGGEGDFTFCNEQCIF